MKAVGCAIACMLAASPARAQPRTSLLGPQLAVGDGTTEVALQLSGARGRPRAVASAGTIARIDRDGDHHSITFVPPRVAQEMVVTVSVRINREGGTVSHALRVVPPAAEAGRQDSGGPFHMTGPTRIFLGDSTPVPIRLTIERSDALPTLIASTGGIGPLRRDSGDVWTAVYQPPAELVPQLAFVVAVTPDGSTFDHLVIPLYGRATVALRSEPNASVAVRVGDIDYGPVRTDRRGRAELAVAAPPGAAQASAIARDGVGNEKRRRLALDPPPLPRLWAACPPAGDRVYVFSMTESARMTSDVELELSADTGRFDRPTWRAPGVYEVGYTGPRDAERIATIKGDRDARASCRPVEPGRARGRELWLSLAAGYLSDLDRVAGPALTVGLAYRGMVGPVELGAGIETGVLIGSIDPESGSPDPDPERAVAAPILAKLSVGLPVGRAVPYAALQLGGAVVNHDEDLSLRPALGGAAGLGIELGGRAAIGIEVGYLHIALDQAIAGESGLGGFRLGAGCGVRF